MPQVARDVVKDRARRLRRKGEAALLKHLGEEVGAKRNALIETDCLGRTEGFTLVRFATAVTPGDILPVTIVGHDGKELLAA
jgi:threonylcarbamoyladenosine tRNA methylthiotransferase MtaB